MNGILFYGSHDANIYINKIKLNFDTKRDVLHTNAQEIKDLLGCLYIISKL